MLGVDMDADGQKSKLEAKLRSIRLHKLAHNLNVVPPDPRPQPESKRSGAEVDRNSEAQPTQQDLDSERILKRMLATNCNWQEMKPYAWDVFRKWPRPELGGRLIELAYLHGCTQDVVEVLRALIHQTPEAYLFVSIDLRPYLVLKLWQQGHEEIINTYLHLKSLDGKRLSLEKLLMFRWCFDKGDKQGAWKVFSRNEDEILGAVKEFASSLKLSLGSYFYQVGSLAAAMGKLNKARSLLEQVPPRSKEFKSALDLIPQLWEQKEDKGFFVFSDKLKQEQDWQLRISLLRSFFVAVDTFDSVSIQEKISLNQLLKKPSQWFPQITQAWFQLSQLLVEYNHLEVILPNLMCFFQSHQERFHSGVFERAIWEPVIHIQCKNIRVQKYWQGVAKLHIYIGGEFNKDTLLWDAKELVEAARDEAHPMSLRWVDLHQAVKLHINRKLNVKDSEKTLLLGKIKVVGDEQELKDDDIDFYIDTLKYRNLSIVDRLQKLVRERGNQSLEIKILRRKAQLSHFTNSDLKQIWTLSRSLKEPDLAWRTATVLNQRGVLGETFLRAWDLSGERRLTHMLQPIPKNLLHILYHGWDADDKAFAESIILVAARIPELLAIVDQRFRPYRLDSNTPLDKKFEKELTKYPWLQQGKKIYGSHPDQGLEAMLPFAYRIPESPWVRVLLQVANRLGLNCWKWQLSRLSGSLGGLVPQILRHQEGDHTAKVGRWLRSLNPLERKAWYHLMATAERSNNDYGYSLLGRLTCRIAVTIYQNNSQALENLIEMECPLDIKWDIENFILSREYSDFRHKFGTASHFDIPDSLPAMK